MNYKSLLMTAVAGVVMTSIVPMAAATLQGSINVAQAAAHEPYSSDSQVGTLLDDPKAKTVLQQLVPDVVNGEQIDMARGMTLRQLQQYAPDKLSDDVLKKIDAELAKLNAPKT